MQRGKIHLLLPAPPFALHLTLSSLVTLLRYFLAHDPPSLLPFLPIPFPHSSPAPHPPPSQVPYVPLNLFLSSLHDYLSSPLPRRSPPSLSAMVLPDNQPLTFVPSARLAAPTLLVWNLTVHGAEGLCSIMPDVSAPPSTGAAPARKWHPGLGSS